jgi:RecA-family ATPase
MATLEEFKPFDIPLRDKRNRRKANGPDETPLIFKCILDPVSLEGASIAEREWIVRDYIPQKAVTLLSGDGGQGKSIIALQLAAARALARDWLGLLPEPGRTIVLSCEDDADEISRRLDKIRKFYGARFSELGDIRIIDLAGEESLLAEPVKGRLAPTRVYQTLAAFVAEFTADLVILDVLADLFGGEERDRAQVRQFINLLKGLCRKYDCAILLLSHPSLTGMNTGSGLSGSTDWNNGVRSRLYLQTPKASDGTALNNKNLRTFQGLKSNYGECGGKLDLEWRNGVFVPVQGLSGFDKMAAEQKADDIFLQLLAKFTREGRDVSPNKSPSFAPAVFSKHRDSCGISSNAFSAAMDRLLDSGKIKIVTFGPLSHQRKKLILGEQSSDA